MLIHQQLSLFLLAFSPTLSFAWICFPPPGIRPISRDCRTLILGLKELSLLPHENHLQRWGRHLPTTALRTVHLPKWYWLDEGPQPPTTCAVVVDVDGIDFFAVDTFRLKDVAAAAQTVYAQCLSQRDQLGLEFPSEEAHVYAKVVRFGGAPGPGLMRGDRKGGVRRVVLPGARVVLVISDEGPGGERNGSTTE